MIRAVRRSRAPVVFPAHPRTRKILETKFSKDELPGNLVLTNPLGYVDMIALISNARGVLTDWEASKRIASSWSRGASR